MRYFIQGLLAMLVISLSTIVISVVVLLLVIPKLLAPTDAARNMVARFSSTVGELWIGINKFVISRYRGMKWDLELPAGLDRSGRYLVLCNHQSWVDILVLQSCLNRRAPFMRFMLKQQLIWVPFIGLAWWALDFPFLRRYSREELLKNPALREKDLRNAARACEKLKHIPVSMMSFPEGTRFTPAKHDAQNSPYSHLLRPRYGGLGQVLFSFGDGLQEVIDVTINYPDGIPTFWQFISGQVRRISVDAKLRTIDPDLRGVDFRNHPKSRARLKQWVNRLWEEKDQHLERACVSER
ncbi:acetyltransferase [Elongatibacter sediminis]|uniref:Acetyltransferase n=1 Tax=Elongatibacter sediminis TaxID=3119006 RepID=A0AAW9R8F5_9GAMM